MSGEGGGMSPQSVRPNEDTSQWGYDPYIGITLRDWFAGQALTSLAGYLDGEFTEANGEQATTENVAKCAQRCYLIADAMLKAREQG